MLHKEILLLYNAMPHNIHQAQSFMVHLKQTNENFIKMFVVLHNNFTSSKEEEENNHYFICKEESFVFGIGMYICCFQCYRGMRQKNISKMKCIFCFVHTISDCELKD